MSSTATPHHLHNMSKVPPKDANCECTIETCNLTMLKLASQNCELLVPAEPVFPSPRSAKRVPFALHQVPGRLHQRFAIAWAFAGVQPGVGGGGGTGEGGQKLWYPGTTSRPDFGPWANWIPFPPPAPVRMHHFGSSGARVFDGKMAERLRGAPQVRPRSSDVTSHSSKAWLIGGRDI